MFTIIPAFLLLAPTKVPAKGNIANASAGFKNVFYPKEKGCFRMDIIQCPYNKISYGAGMSGTEHTVL